MRFKTVYFETSHLSIHKTIPVMTDQIIDVSNNQLIHFLNGLKSEKNSYGLFFFTHNPQRFLVLLTN